MKKYVLITAVFTACLTLCAVVRPQSQAVEETPIPLHAAAVGTPEPTVAPATAEAETMPLAETPQAEPLHEVIPEPTPMPEETLPILELEFAPAPAPSQAVTDPQPGGMVYIPGFGWLGSQGEGTVIYAEDIYENGSKVGIMG